MVPVVRLSKTVANLAHFELQVLALLASERNPMTWSSTCPSMLEYSFA